MIYKIIFKIQNSKLKTAVSWYLVQQILPISHLKKKNTQIHPILRIHFQNVIQITICHGLISKIEIRSTCIIIVVHGLIPFVYRAIVQYKNGGQRSWLSESPSCSYILLPGDSGRFQTSDIQLFRSDYAFSATSSSSMAPSANAKIMVSTGVQSPARRMTSRRVVTRSPGVVQCGRLWVLDMEKIPLMLTIFIFFKSCRFS
ncbi:unnamed protein product, partial [Vitis vinifera]